MKAKHTATIGRLVLLVTLIACSLSLHAQTNLTGIWRVEGSGTSFPWTLILHMDGNELTGTVRTCSSQELASDIRDSVINGSTIQFKCTSNDGNRTITLNGTVKGDTIDFGWQKETKPGASPFPRDGMFGALAPPRFTAKKISDSTRPDPSSASVAMQKLLDAHNYPEFARQLPDAGGMTPEEGAYFRGVLASLQGRFSEAVRPLISAVNTHDYSLTSYQVERAIEILGDIATRMFRYGDAVQMYDDVDRIFGARMGGAIGPVRQKRAVAASLQNVPAQTIQIAGDFTLKKTGLEYPISIDGKTFSAVLDTGASFSIVSESTAKKWGIAPMGATVTFNGYGSGEFSAHPAVLPVLQIGKAELHNVAVFITADQNLILAGAILGCPVTSALGRLTFDRDQALTVSAASPRADADGGVALWAGYSSLLVSVNTKPGGNSPGVFVLDTGSLSTYLTQRFLEEHRSDFPAKPDDSARLAGAGGVHVIPAYAANRLPLWFGSTPALLNGQHILAESQGGEVENYQGLIGEDVLRQFSGYTIDYRTMRFSVTP